MTRLSVPATLIVLLAGAPRGAISQVPSPAAAAALVSRAVIDPYPVRFTRGDSAVLAVTLVDLVGGTVRGADWTLRTEGSQVRFRRVETGRGVTYLLTGDQPVSQVFYVSLSTGGPPRDVDSVVVTVADWAVTQVVIDDLPFLPYVGTTFRLTARALTDHGTVSDLPILWRTDDPCHARVMPEGAISFAQPGKISVFARAGGVTARKEINIQTNPVRMVDISPNSAQTRVGDLVHLRISAEDRRGLGVDKLAYTFAIAGVDSVGGEIVDDGDFIARRPGTYVVRVSAGDATAEAIIEVGPRPPAAPVTVAAHAAMPREATRALAVFTGRDTRDYAYVGARDPGGAAPIYVWDVTNPTTPVLTDSVRLSAGAVSDLQVQGDASWAVVGREPGPGGQGGLAVLDLATPAHPVVVAQLTEGVSGGIRGVGISPAAPFVYAANATNGSLAVFDLSDPRQPRLVGSVEPTPGRPADVQDVWADGKNALLAAGSDGLFVIDVGDRGSPTAPRLRATLGWPGAAARTVTRSGRYAFIGETIEGCATCVSGPAGGVRIVDVQKTDAPRIVASFTVPEAGAGAVAANGGVLYAAYHQGGLRIVDVAGELAHELYQQARQSGWFLSGPQSATRPDMVAAQEYKGHVFAVDAHAGLWVLNHRRAARLAP